MKMFALQTIRPIFIIPDLNPTDQFVAGGIHYQVDDQTEQKKFVYRLNSIDLADNEKDYVLKYERRQLVDDKPSDKDVYNFTFYINKEQVIGVCFD